MTVPIDIESRKICVHPNNRDVSLISLNSFPKGLEVIVSLVFTKKTEFNDDNKTVNNYRD